MVQKEYGLKRSGLIFHIFHMSKVTSFFVGCFVGVYLDQSHTMPNVERWVQRGIRALKEWEERSRK